MTTFQLRSPKPKNALKQHMHNSSWFDVDLSARLLLEETIAELSEVGKSNHARSSSFRDIDLSARFRLEEEPGESASNDSGSKKESEVEDSNYNVILRGGRLDDSIHETSRKK